MAVGVRAGDSIGLGHVEGRGHGCWRSQPTRRQPSTRSPATAAIRDLASLVRKIDMLPWDVSGPMEDSYDGETSDNCDLLIDQLAAACREHDEPELPRIYGQLAVPASLVC